MDVADGAADGAALCDGAYAAALTPCSASTSAAPGSDAGDAASEAVRRRPGRPPGSGEGHWWIPSEDASLASRMAEHVVDALTRSLKCPVCRFQLGDDTDTHDVWQSDDESVADTFITVKEAIKVAREVAKTDKATARSMKTLGSWKKRMKEARTTLKKAYKKLKPFEDAMYAELDEYEKKLDARFKARNAKLIEEIATARAMAGRATGSWRATRTRIAKKHARTRIAKKHGFVYRRWN